MSKSPRITDFKPKWMKEHGDTIEDGPLIGPTESLTINPTELDWSKVVCKTSEFRPLKVTDPESSATKFFGQDGTEMIAIRVDGFYVRGVKLEQDANEARAVFEAFRDWVNHFHFTPAPTSSKAPDGQA